MKCYYKKKTPKFKCLLKTEFLQTKQKKKKAVMMPSYIVSIKKISIKLSLPSRAINHAHIIYIFKPKELPVSHSID